MIQFFIPCNPPTKTDQEKKIRVVNGKPVVYKPPELAAVKAKLIAQVSQHAPAEPMEGAIRLITKWCYARGEHRDGEYKITKPDTDNTIKLFKDCMTVAKYWHDDAQVASEITEKFWAEIPGIFVRVEQIDE